MTVVIDKDKYITFSELNTQLGIVKVTASGLDELGIKPDYIVGPTRYYQKGCMPHVRQALGNYLLRENLVPEISEPGQSPNPNCPNPTL